MAKAVITIEDVMTDGKESINVKFDIEGIQEVLSPDIDVEKTTPAQAVALGIARMLDSSFGGNGADNTADDDDLIGGETLGERQCSGENGVCESCQ